MKQRRLGTYGNAKHGIFLNNELRESVAYKCLTPAARLVLVDWIGRYMQKSKGDTENLKNTGISYSLSDCIEVIGVATFKRSRSEIVAKGFFERPEKLQTIKPGSRGIYTPSTKWRTYQPTGKELAILKTAAKSKEAAMQRWNNFRDSQEREKRGRQSHE